MYQQRNATTIISKIRQGESYVRNSAIKRVTWRMKLRKHFSVYFTENKLVIYKKFSYVKLLKNIDKTELENAK